METSRLGQIHYCDPTQYSDHTRGPGTERAERAEAERDQARQIARRAYRNWLTPASQRRATDSFEISSITADALGIDALPDWLTENGDAT